MGFGQVLRGDIACYACISDFAMSPYQSKNIGFLFTIFTWSQFKAFYNYAVYVKKFMYSHYIKIIN